MNSKKVILFLFMTLLLVSPVFADGMIYIRRDADRWLMHKENSQVADIVYDNGYQRMILAIETDHLEGGEAVWIFPVPSDPDDIAIDIVKGEITFGGSNVLDEANRKAGENAIYSIMWNAFPPVFMLMSRMMYGAGQYESLLGGVAGKRAGVTVYESISKMGMTTELVTAESGEALLGYVQEKDLNLPAEAQAKLDEYIGEGFSFVISWISEPEEFVEEQPETKRYYDYDQSYIGIDVTFPAEDLYFPMKMTSVYGSEKIPVVLYIVGFVKPQLYDSIKPYTEVEYMYTNYLSVSGIQDFVDDTRDVAYTKVKIEAPSKFYKEDIWIKREAPMGAVMAKNYVMRSGWIFLISFIVFSLLAAFIAGWLILRKTDVKMWHYALLGLGNIFSVFIFGLLVYFLRTRKVEEDLKDYFRERGAEVMISPMVKKSIILTVTVVLFLLWLLMGRFEFGVLHMVMMFVTLIGMIVMGFILCEEEIRHEISKYLRKFKYRLKVMDLKKFLFMIIFNIAGSLTLLWLIFSDYQRRKGLAHILGFVKYYSGRYMTLEGNVPMFIIITVFLVSILLIDLFELVFKKLRTRGLYVMHKDARKIIFFFAYEGIFILLVVLMYIILRLIF